MKCNNFPYNGEAVELLQEIFRHKIVHLAQPKLVVNSKGRDIMWRYEYPNVTNRLKVECVGHIKQIKNILTPYPIYYDHVFTIGITQLSIDISDSVTRQSDGYIAKLKNNYKDSQRKFDDAIDQIYDARNK
jgi:hypothetical protein